MDDDPFAPSFRAIEQACGPHGGLLKADDLLHELRRRMPQPLSWMARRIATRDMLSFTHRHVIWIPRFQFASEDVDATAVVAGMDAAGFELRPVAARVARHLRDLHTDRSLVAWFTEPHARLGGQRPVDLLDTQAAAVMAAAEADAAADVDVDVQTASPKTGTDA